MSLSSALKTHKYCCKLQNISKSQNKLKDLIIFTSKTQFFKSSNHLWFRGFSVDYSMNPITENVLDILL